MGQTCSNSCGYSNRPPGCDSDGRPRPAATPLRSSAAKDDDSQVPFHSNAFRISVSSSEDATSPQPLRAGWRACYSLGPVLGDGISAKVYEAEALPVQGIDASNSRSLGDGGILASCSSVGLPHCVRERGRRVALKRFHRFGSRTFQKELAALRRVGVHPHVLRLLESYQGFGGEDVLVLEYCDGSTLYDLYAREHPNNGLPERLIARLVRQLLLALEHLNACGVEHQDVKPENMMLHDISVSSQRGELKLGDFGWAALGPPAIGSDLPVTGAGSLWYAPPELNPPVEGITPDPNASMDAHGNPLRGRSDMWSVGVVLYLLLVGHNPFNRALKQPNPEAVDQEVMRLTALGQFNRRADRWLQLHVDARDLISVLLRVKPCARPAATEALQHPFLTRRVAKAYEEYEGSVFFHGTVSAWADREAAWARLDGLQRLSWVAVARAVGEPELEGPVIVGAMEGVQNSEQAAVPSREATYLWQLARELATTPVFHWMKDRGAWADVVRLAFCYLDLDGDGILSAQDLAGHMLRTRSGEEGVVPETVGVGSAGAAAQAAASRWVQRWQDSLPTVSSAAVGADRTTHQPRPAVGGLSPASLREALLASHHRDDAIFNAFDTAPSSSRSGHHALVHDIGQAGGVKDAYPMPVGHDEEEISWKDMVTTGAGASRGGNGSRVPSENSAWPCSGEMPAAARSGPGFRAR